MPKEQVIKTDREILEILVERVETLNELVEDLKASQAELVEKIANMSTPGADFDYDDTTRYDD